MTYSSSNFLEINLLISKVGILTQARIGVSSIAVPLMGSMVVSISFLYENLKQIPVSVLISWVDTRTQIRMGVGSITFHARGA